ncbi:G2/mitotic-specific cyclin-4 [Podosphaera aphanis]|nr:G2/mitotic-specific cyclin-4 [Podosphaera aphanis]
MDARPQRPARGIHLQADENCAPAVCVKQPLLHQRHKSTGHIAMLAVGGLKNITKRTAFGDVSNTAKNLSTIQDDLITSGKQTHEIPRCTDINEKTSSFMRPAQRPSATIFKASRGCNSSTSELSHVAPLAKKILPHSQALAKRALSKRATSVFKDSDGRIVNNHNSHLSKQTSVSIVSSIDQNIAPYHPRSHIIPAHKSETLYETQQNENILINERSPREKRVKESCNTSLKVHEPTLLVNDTYVDDSQECLSPDVTNHIPVPPEVSEVEEYWEDEEEEAYDEQCYMTAHSHQSRGDNTTGGATTFLFPKITNVVKQELESARKHVESSRTTEDLEDERWDTSMVSEYGDEIFSYMRELEAKMLPNAHYMDLQTEIQWSMRSVLMDWLIQVHHRFSLLPETLFLCVNYVDRFLSCKIVSLGKLQLVGATAIFVAAKYEEINCPSVSEIVYMVDGGYTVEEILKAERFMLSMLQFELGWPGPMSFLRRISKADEYDLETRTLAKYFLEVTIMDERFVGSPPSYIAAGSHCLARLMLKRGDWSKKHVYYSGYTWTQLRPLVAMIKECCENPQKHHNAVFEKYSDRRYKRAAQFVYTEIALFTLPPAQAPRHSLPQLEDFTTLASYENKDASKRMARS